MYVRDCMTISPRSCTPDDSIDTVARTMAEGDFGAVPILEGDRPVGIVTDRDIAVRGVAQGRAANTPVRDIMSKSCICVRSDAEIGEAVHIMENSQVRRLAVVDEEGCLCGMLATADLARQLHDQSTVGEVIEEVSKPSR